MRQKCAPPMSNTDITNTIHPLSLLPRSNTDYTSFPIWTSGSQAQGATFCLCPGGGHFVFVMITTLLLQKNEALVNVYILQTVI